MDRTSALRMVERARNALSQAQARLEALDQFGPEPPMGTVIRFDKRFVPRGQVYSYAAIRCANGWSTTGPRSPKAYSWDQLTYWLLTEGEPTTADDVDILTSDTPADRRDWLYRDDVGAAIEQVRYVHVHPPIVSSFNFDICRDAKGVAVTSALDDLLRELGFDQ